MTRTRWERPARSQLPAFTVYICYACGCIREGMGRGDETCFECHNDRRCTHYVQEEGVTTIAQAIEHVIGKMTKERDRLSEVLAKVHREK